MKIKKIIGYVLIAVYVSVIIYMYMELPWYSLPLSIGVGIILTATVALMGWLFDEGKGDKK